MIAMNTTLTGSMTLRSIITIRRSRRGGSGAGSQTALAAVSATGHGLVSCELKIQNEN